ncbi:MAG TPA: hypothetical protein VNE00_26250 [Paraburkholderia sp.]|nr:hypothetical protein [Paraburkholderia sp.]
MFGFHVAEIARTSAHDMPMPAAMHDAPAAVCAGGAHIECGARPPQPFAEDGHKDAGAGHSMLRLRGGGGAHGKRDADGDRNRLLSSSGRRASRAPARRAEVHAREADDAALLRQRNEFQTRLNDAESALNAASQRFRQASRDRDRLEVDVEYLEQEAARASDPVHEAELGGRLEVARAACRATVEEVARYEKETRDASRQLFAVRQERWLYGLF